MSDPRVEAAALALCKSWWPPEVARSQRTADATVALAAADSYDTAHGIVRIDLGDPATIERIARAVCLTYHPEAEADWDADPHAFRGWFKFGEAVAAALREGNQP